MTGRSTTRRKEKLPTVKGLFKIIHQLLPDSNSQSRWQLFANAVLVVTTMAMAITAYYDLKTNRSEIDSKRPFISLENPELGQKENGKYNFKVLLKNVGGRAIASGAKIGLYPISGGNQGNYTFPHYNFLLVANEIIPGSPAVKYDFDFSVENSSVEIAPQFFVVFLEYEDEILEDEGYDQMFRFQWKINEQLPFIKDEPIVRGINEQFAKLIKGG